MTLPDHIRKAFKDRPRSLEFPSDLAVESGQFRIIEAEGLKRQVLVVRVDSEEGFCEVMLAHPYVEQATGVDVVITREETGVPYTMVVQTDCHGMVWTVELGKIIGVVGEDAMAALGAVASGEFPEGRYLPGVKLAGLVDARWEFKVSEGQVMSALTRDCTAALIDLTENPYRSISFATYDVESESDCLDMFPRVLADLENPRVQLEDLGESEDPFMEWAQGQGLGDVWENIIKDDAVYAATR